MLLTRPVLLPLLLTPSTITASYYPIHLLWSTHYNNYYQLLLLLLLLLDWSMLSLFLITRSRNDERLTVGQGHSDRQTQMNTATVLSMQALALPVWARQTCFIQTSITCWYYTCLNGAQWMLSILLHDVFRIKRSLQTPC